MLPRLTCSGVIMPNVVHTSMPRPLILDTMASTRCHWRGPTCIFVCVCVYMCVRVQGRVCVRACVRVHIRSVLLWTGEGVGCG